MPLRAIEPPLDSPDRRRLPPLLRRAWYSLNQAFRRRLTPLRLTPDQFTVLRTLLEGDSAGLTQTALARAMSSDPNTIASLVERMEEGALVERRLDEKDRRARRLRVTPLGRRRYAAAREIAVSLQAEVLAALPEERREPFLADLAALGAACRTAADAAE
ncbi:MAG: MarR family winged helix-turn-helix transcriptional regulator [Limisphaerales bacterium]